MSAGIIWAICLSVWAIQIVMVYVTFLYWEYKKYVVDRKVWKERSFTEFVYEGEHPDYDNPLIWVSYIPYFGIIFWITAFGLDYAPYFDIAKVNPMRFLLKLVLRKKYLLERVSKEI